MERPSYKQHVEKNGFPAGPLGATGGYKAQPMDRWRTPLLFSWASGSRHAQSSRMSHDIGNGITWHRQNIKFELSLVQELEMSTFVIIQHRHDDRRCFINSISEILRIN